MEENNIWEILVPTVMNGKSVRTRHHKEWDKKIKCITGGLTITPPTKGYWVSKEGETISERMIPVRIMCDDFDIELIADITASHYNQDAIMFYKISNEVTVKHYNK